MKHLLASFVVLFSMQVALPQSNQLKWVFEAGTEIPLYYATGIGYRITPDLSVKLSAGFLTSPYDKVILDVLELFGVEKAITRTIGGAFSNGWTGKFGVNYSHGNFYSGINYSWLGLKAKDTPVALVNNYYKLSLPFLIVFTPLEYELVSNLHNLGIIVGKNIELDKQVFLGTEIGLSKTFFSNTTLYSAPDQDLRIASELINAELGDYYRKYAWLPSLNLYIRIFI